MTISRNWQLPLRRSRALDKGELLKNELQGIRYEPEGQVAVITLDRPRYRNAQNLAMLYSLDEACREFAADDALSVAVLKGTGPVGA